MPRNSQGQSYAVVTPVVQRAGAFHFDVYRPTDTPDSMPIQHTYASRELAWCGRHGWVSYYKGKHVDVRRSFA